MIDFIIWNGSPEIFSVGSLALRWYGLLFALGFLVTQQILYHIYREEGKPERDVDTLTLVMFFATIIGARLGHIFFYEPQTLIQDPLSVVLPFELSPFRFTGFQGLASHGAAIGILFGLWVYAKYSITFSKPVESTEENADPNKKKFGIFIKKISRPGQNYLQVLDRIVILVCLAGAFIRLGNFFNSEIIGKPSNSAISVVYFNRVTEAIMQETDGKNPVDAIKVKSMGEPEGPNALVPIDILLVFKQGVSEQEANIFI